MIEAILTAATLAAAPPAAPAPPDAREVYARRVVLLEADAKCGLLSARERLALEGSTQQARGALLRAGSPPEALRGRAEARAAELACADPALQTEVAALRAGFARWASQRRQDFPGEHQDWRAARGMVPEVMSWALWQDLDGGFRIGLTGDGADRAVILAMPAGRGQTPPRAAILEFRDRAQWDSFFDPGLGGLFPASGDGGALARQAPPASLSTRVWASGPAEEDIHPPSPEGDWRYWTFPYEVVERLAALDPRDVARLIVEYPGDRVRTFYVEIGDLAAAQAFLAAGDSPLGQPAS